MDMALTLVSIASFFAMVLAWIMVPTSAAEKTEIETAPLAAPQVAN
jgi:hypothetical protein